LVKTALDHARSLGVNVIPRCPFVAAYLRRHPAEQDLVTDRYRFLVENGR
jgi:predicted GNAT family acetyltransferase